MESDGCGGVGRLANVVQYRVEGGFLVNDFERVVRCFRGDFVGPFGRFCREKFDLRVDVPTNFWPVFSMWSD